MAIQQWKCYRCECIIDVHQPVGQVPIPPEVCPDCEYDDFGRVYNVQVVRPMHEHLNSTTGTIVSDMKGFKSDLQRKSEDAYLRTGVEHNYEPLDYGDVKHVVEESGGVGLDGTNRARHAKGEKTVEI